eukprot:4553799-Alexandrium_andersonii.AAC.1
MSASLVGSEMCIRDSPSPRMPAVGRAGRWHRARRRLRCAATAAHHPCVAEHPSLRRPVPPAAAWAAFAPP